MVKKIKGSATITKCYQNIIQKVIFTAKNHSKVWQRKREAENTQVKRFDHLKSIRNINENVNKTAHKNKVSNKMSKQKSSVNVSKKPFK